MKKLRYILLGAFLMVGGTALAVNVSVPSAPSSGYSLISTTTGNYLATTTGVVSCTGATCGSGSYVLGNALSITVSGGSGNVSTSTPDVANQVAVFSTNSATPALIGGYAGLTYDSSLAKLTTTNLLATSATTTGKFVAGDPTNPVFVVYPSAGRNAIVIDTSGNVSIGNVAANPAMTLTVGGPIEGKSSLTLANVAILNGGATSTGEIAAQTSSSTNLIISSAGTGATKCLQVDATGNVSAATAACASSGGAFDPFTHPAANQSATSSLLILSGGINVNFGSSTITGNLIINGNSTTTSATTTNLYVSSYAGFNGPLVIGTSTASTTIWGNGATSTFANGIDLPTTGCFSILGTCLQTVIQNATAYKQAVNYATAAILPGTPSYSNGSSGVGATLTEVGFGALSVDGQTVTLGQRILVKNQADQTQNGIYTVTTVGSGIASYLLTRATDYNNALDIYAGTTIPVITGGTVNGDTQWTESTTGTIVVGTSNIVFIETSLGTNVDTFGQSWEILSSNVLTPTSTSVGIISYASSTIGNGGLNGGLTVSGGATSSLLNIWSPIGANGLLLFRISSSTAQYATSTLFAVDNTGSTTIGGGTPQSGLTINGAATTTGNFNAANNGFAVTGTGNITKLSGNGVSVTSSNIQLGSSGGPVLLQNNVSTLGSSLKLQTTPVNSANTSITDAITFFIGTNERARLNGNGAFGLGSSSPMAQFVIHALDNNGNSGTTTLFAIASSSSATGTTTLFQVNNVGLASTTNLTISGLGNGSAQCLHINAAGVVTGAGSDCASTAGFLQSYDAWSHAAAGQSGTTSVILAQLISGTSTIGTLTATSSITNLSVKSALVLNGSGGLEGAYAGSAPCTNQVALSVSATGVITCTSVTDAMLSSTFLKGVDPFTHVAAGTSATSTPLIESSTLTLSATTSPMLVSFFSGTGTLVATSSPQVDSIFATSSISTNRFYSPVQIGTTALLYGSMLGIASSSTSTIQATIQNTSATANASADYIVGTDNMTNYKYFSDLGCNSSAFTDSTFTINGANDCYLYSQDASLAIGTASSSVLSKIQFFTGGTLAANERMRITSTGKIGIGTTTPNWLLQIAGTRPALAISDTIGGIASNLQHWLISSMGGNLYFATSTAGYATTTVPSLSINNQGMVSIGTSTPYLSGDGLEVSGVIFSEEIGTSSLANEGATRTYDWSRSTQYNTIMTQNTTSIVFNNGKPGMGVRLVLCQDVTGSRTVAGWPTSVIWSAGTTPTQTSTANKCDVYTFTVTATSTASGIKYLGAAVQNF